MTSGEWPAPVPEVVGSITKQQRGRLSSKGTARYMETLYFNVPN